MSLEFEEKIKLEYPIYDFFDCSKGVVALEYPEDWRQGIDYLHKYSEIENTKKLIPRDVFKTLWWEIDKPEVDCKELFNDIVKAAKNIIEFRKPIEYKILALWIMSTWKKDRWETIPHIAFTSKFCNRGKTEAWLFTKELVWHSFDATKYNLTTIKEYADDYNAAVFIDNINSSLNQELRTFIDCRYKRKIDMDREPAPITYFCINGTLELPESTYQRIISFDMPKGYSKEKFSRTDFPGLQIRLMSYKYKNNDPDVACHEKLKGRIAELFTPIVSVAKQVGLDVEDIIEYAEYIKSTWNDSKDETIEYKILDIIANSRKDQVTYRSIISSLGWDYKNRSDTIRLGSVIKKLNIVTHKGENGRYFYRTKENDKILNKLYIEYGLI